MLGSRVWGHVAQVAGVETALLVATALMIASPLLGLRLRMPPVKAREEEGSLLENPEVRVPISGRHGTVAIEIEYRIQQKNSPEFRRSMQDLRLIRRRNGAYGWSLARNMADPNMWIERYHFRTWDDYLRQRNCSTLTERTMEDRIIKQYHEGPGKVRVRRTIERSFG